MTGAIRVGMASMAVRRGSGTLECPGIGSGASVAMYDPSTHVGGMAHVMLPAAPKGDDNKFKGADSAIPAMIEAMESEGAVRSEIFACVAGGAGLMASSFGSATLPAVEALLVQAGIPIFHSELGGSQTRCARLDVACGTWRVETSAARSARREAA